jgi:hypothetical protein
MTGMEEVRETAEVAILGKLTKKTEGKKSFN